MTALSKLPAAEAREACVALGASTNWPAEEWAIATQKLLDGLLPMEVMGLTQLIRLVLATKAPPSEIADRMVAEFRKAREVTPDTSGSVLPTTA